LEKKDVTGPQERGRERKRGVVLDAEIQGKNSLRGLSLNESLD